MARIRLTNQSEEIQQLTEQLKEAKRTERRKTIVANAEKVLAELESEYEHCKNVFLKVNGARRILKNQ